MTNPNISVIIPSHRASYLGGLLQALRIQEKPHPAFETIAVCDYDPAKLRKEFPEVKFIVLKDRSISAKRNRGVRESSAETIAFIDDDCIPSPSWVSRGIKHLETHSDCAAVEGLTSIENTPDSTPSLGEYRRLEQPGFRTNNIFYRKSVFLLVGGFDERFTVQREDIDLAFSVQEKGYVIEHDFDIRVMHRLRHDEPWDLLKNCVNRRFDPLLFRKHPRRYREHIGSPFPNSLLMLLGFHATTLLTLCICLPVFAAAAAIDLAAVTALTIRRNRGVGSLRDFCTEWISCFAAPAVLLAALLHGSVRFRKLFLV